VYKRQPERDPDSLGAAEHVVVHRVLGSDGRDRPLHDVAERRRHRVHGPGGGFLRQAAATAAGVAGGALLFEGISNLFGHSAASGMYGGGMTPGLGETVINNYYGDNAGGASGGSDYPGSAGGGEDFASNQDFSGGSDDFSGGGGDSGGGSDFSGGDSSAC